MYCFTRFKFCSQITYDKEVKEVDFGRIQTKKIEGSTKFNIFIAYSV